MSDVRRLDERNLEQLLESLNIAASDPRAVEMRAQMESNWTEFVEDAGGTVSTSLESFFLSGERIRVDTVKLEDHETPLEKLADSKAVSAEERGQPSIQCWDGQNMASLFVDVEHRRDPKGPQVRDFKSLNPAKNVSLPIPLQVGAYSDESLAMIVRVLTGSGAVATANVEARSGEDVVVVKNSLGEMSIEAHFLPDKGYAQSFLAFSKGGTTTTVEEYFDFFDCGNGIWLPLRGSRDGYGVDGSGRRVLERRYEFFAIGKPDAGCDFAPDTFDVLNSERFKAAKSLPNTTNPVPVVPKVGTSRVWRWDWIFGVFLGLVLLSLSLLRRRFSRRQ